MTEYIVREPPRSEHKATIFGEDYLVKEYSLKVIAWPCEPGSNAVFIIDKKLCPRWLHAIPNWLPTPARNLNQNGIAVARLGPSGGVILAASADEPLQVVIENHRLRIAEDMLPPEVRFVDWEILPPEELERILQGKPTLTEGILEDERLRLERLAYLAMLQPERWWIGRSQKEFSPQKYFVAEFFGKKLAIADCPTLGNALFAVKTEECHERFGIAWQTVFNYSKREAQRFCVRICHKGRWEDRLKQLAGR